MKRYLVNFGFFVLFVLLFSLFVNAGLCCVESDCCNGKPCEIGAYKSTATDFNGCYPTQFWDSNGHYSYDFGSFESDAFSGFEIIAHAFSTASGDRLANDYVAAKIKEPDSDWLNLCDKTSCSGGNISQGINSTNIFYHTILLNGIPVLFSWDTVVPPTKISTVSYTFDKSGNYALRLFVLGTGSVNEAKIELKFNNNLPGDNLSHEFFSSSSYAMPSDNKYYLATNAICSDQITWSNATGTICEGVDELEEFDYIEYAWCIKTNEICGDGKDNDCDELIDEGCVLPQRFCVGLIDGNAVLISADENVLGPLDNNQNLLVDSNTSAKCEWRCKEGYEKNEDVCIANIIPEDVKKEGTKNAIIDFKTTILEGKVFLNVSCFYDLVNGEQEIIKINLYKNGSIIPLDENEFECLSKGSSIELTPDLLFEENTQYSIRGKIDSVCEVCERETFFYYVAPKNESAIPDSNFLSIIAFLSAMLFLMYKKRI